MSQQNVEIVRRAYEAWNRGDLESAFDLVHPEVEVSLPRDFPEAGTYRGRAEVRRWFTDEVLPAFEGLQALPQRFVDAGDRVVVFIRYSGRGTASGIEVRGVGADAHVVTLRDGKLASLVMYQGTEEALGAVGLG